MVALKKEKPVDVINAIFKKAAETNYKGILEYTEEPIVSLDVKSNPHSAIIAGDLTTLVGKQLKLYAFFDNEYGYTSRMIDWLRYLRKGIA
jgi:glyceraldehyde 3-phosphate dehydrogenase